jgi:hypothetical protein
LQAQREFVEADLRRLRANAGQTTTSIRNLLARVVATAPPNSLPGAAAEATADTSDRAAGAAHAVHLMSALEVVADRLEDLCALLSLQQNQLRDSEAAASLWFIAPHLLNNTTFAGIAACPIHASCSIHR